MFAFKVNAQIFLLVSIHWFYTVYGQVSGLDNRSPNLEWTQCRESNNRESLYGLTLQQCWDQCRLRPQCLAVNYWRTKELCEIDYDESGAQVRSSLGPCVRIIRQDNSVVGICATCGERTTCDANEEMCRVKACQLLKTKYGKVYGNMYAVGSKAKIVYNTSPKLGAYSFCQPNSLWTLVQYRMKGSDPSSIQTIHFYNTKRTQLEANQICEEQGQSLIRFDSREKIDDVIEFLDSVSDSYGAEFWIQGRYVAGSWKFDNGDEFDYRSIIYRDMNGGDEPCVRIRNRKNDRHVNDKPCYYKLGFICESTN